MFPVHGSEVLSDLERPKRGVSLGRSPGAQHSKGLRYICKDFFAIYRLHVLSTRLLFKDSHTATFYHVNTNQLRFIFEITDFQMIRLSLQWGVLTILKKGLLRCVLSNSVNRPKISSSEERSKKKKKGNQIFFKTECICVMMTRIW